MNEQQKPILPGKGASDYERYLHTDDLLALQKPAEEIVQHLFRHLVQPEELLMAAVRQRSTQKHQTLGVGPISHPLPVY